MYDKEARGMMSELYAIMDDGDALDEYQRGIYETLSWLYEDGDQPEIED